MAKKKHWLQKKYKIGSKIKFPHPHNDDIEDAQIVLHTADARGRIDGARVKFSDGTWIDVPVGRFHKDGSGTGY